MKRRKFLQYSSLSGAGALLASAPALASVVALSNDQAGLQAGLGLEEFDFNVPTIDQAGRVKRETRHTAKFFSESLSRNSNLEMVAIKSDEFTMGTSRGESQVKSTEFPHHRVKISPFFISKNPITQSQWAAVAALPKMKRALDPDPSYFQGGERPVESVSWLEAVEFCDRLSQHTGRQYQLPSEAQWEYACRAGTQTPFHTGETITSQLADYVGTYTYKSETAGEYRKSTMPVGRFAPNAFGLNDMHGNVWEWCADGWSRGYNRAPRDGRAVVAQRSQMRAIRGGGWLDAPASLRSASRSGYREMDLNRTIGFRVSTVAI